MILEEDEVRLHNIVIQAVDAADKTIMDLSKTAEEIDYLTSAVTKAFIEKVHISNTFRMYKSIILKDKND